MAEPEAGGIVGKIFRHPFRTLRNQTRWLYCRACGRFARRHNHPVYTEEMSKGHGFSPQMTRYYDGREGRECRKCMCNSRARHIAKTLIGLYGEGRCRSFVELLGQERFQSLRVAEINGCSGLHQFLLKAPNVRYSEYGSTDPAVPSEDTLNLSYPDQSFDLVLTSDTLEHVPDFDRAIAEIRRVLVPGGLHVFTIPGVWDRAETRVRARIDENGQLVHLMPPCYHGGSLNIEDCLAFYEFGQDVVDRVKKAGFDVKIEQEPKNPAIRTFVTRRVD